MTDLRTYIANRKGELRQAIIDAQARISECSTMLSWLSDIEDLLPAEAPPSKQAGEPSKQSAAPPSKQAKGGRARKQALTPERRRAIASKAAKARHDGAAHPEPPQAAALAAGARESGLNTPVRAVAPAAPVFSDGIPEIPDFLDRRAQSPPA